MYNSETSRDKVHIISKRNLQARRSPNDYRILPLDENLNDQEEEKSSSIAGTDGKLNVTGEVLLVFDCSYYSQIRKLLQAESKVNEDYIFQYIKVYFSHLINAV